MIVTYQSQPFLHLADLDCLSTVPTLSCQLIIVSRRSITARRTHLLNRCCHLSSWQLLRPQSGYCHLLAKAMD